MKDNNNSQPINYDEIIVEDGENWSNPNSDGFTLRRIVLGHLQKCINEGSKEMTTGGVVTRIIDGQAVPIMLPNQKEIYVRCVKQLLRIVEPDIQRDKRPEFREELNEAKKSLKNLYEAYTNAVGNLPSVDINDPMYNKNPQRYMSTYNDSRKNIDDWYEDQLFLIYENQVFPVLAKFLYHINFYEEASFAFGD